MRLTTIVFPLAVLACGLSWLASVPARGEPRVAGGQNVRVGVSVPSRKAVVGPEQSGVIETCDVEEGDRVRAGDPLLTLTTAPQRLEVERLTILAESDVDLRQAEAELALANTRLTRHRTLVAKGITSDEDLERYAREATLASLAVKRARIDRQLAAKALQQARAKLEQRTVRSPFSGVVARKLKQRGEPIEKNTEALEIVDLAPLWIEFDCPVDGMQSLPIGANVEVRRAALPSDVRIARVLHHAVTADPASHTIRVRLELPNAERPWKPGMKVLVGSTTRPGGKSK